VTAGVCDSSKCPSRRAAFGAAPQDEAKRSNRFEGVI
jgi:hypothetical protein